jgi:cell wall-associated NlpC family hydrolase
MPRRSAIPDLEALVIPLLGEPYARWDCWDLVRHLFKEGCGLDLVRDTERAAVAFQEIWYSGDATDPLSLVQPWDLVIFYTDPMLAISDHVGVVLDRQRFVHARTADTGVALGRLRSWKPRLLQLARYREFM